MAQHIGIVTYLVREYDEAIAWFTTVLGFDLVEDTPLSPTKRWVIVAPPGGRAARLLLARATTPAQVAAIGQQTGGRVALFLMTDDIAHDYAAMSARGVRFAEPIRHEPYGAVAVFSDLYGTRWDLIQMGTDA